MLFRPFRGRLRGARPNLLIVFIVIIYTDFGIVTVYAKHSRDKFIPAKVCEVRNFLFAGNPHELFSLPNLRRDACHPVHQIASLGPTEAP